MRRTGGRRIIVRRDGRLWLLPQDKKEEFTWRRELRRQKLMARWESPPPGPPGGGGPKWSNKRKKVKGMKTHMKDVGGRPSRKCTRAESTVKDRRRRKKLRWEFPQTIPGGPMHRGKVSDAMKAISS